MTSNQIIYFIHCAKCLEEIPEDISPHEWCSMEAGWTDIGFQFWCIRHGMNIAHFDLMGQKVRVAEKK